MKYKIHLSKSRKVSRNLFKKGIKDLVEYVLRKLEVPKCHLSIRFSSPQEIKRLNKVYRGKDSSTDVLTFKYDTSYCEADIIISVEDVQHQAPKWNNDFETELKRVIIHGILHALGYDHEGVPKLEAERMYQLEDTLVRQTTHIRVISLPQ